MKFGFPEVNATLNATSGILLVIGYILIKRGKWRAHGYVMAAAVTVSAAFLCCYLTYHYSHGETKTDPKAGWIRTVYYWVLFPHLTLALCVLPMIVITLRRAYRRDWVRHRKIARPTFWIWLYVSSTGVLVYYMLYHIPRLTGRG